jgi:hypothetical protein
MLDVHATMTAYDVAEIRDVSDGYIRRYTLHVVVEPGATAEEMAEIARRLAAGQRHGTPYQALSVGFNDYPEFVGKGYSLGYWEHVPFGEWGRAHEVALGDYSAFQEVDNLKRKDWSQQPTPEQVELWELIDRAYDEINPGPHDDPDAMALAQVAAQKGLDEARVQADIQHVVRWIAR